VRWSESPFVLAASGTLAIHLLLAVAADAIVATHPLHPDPPPPRVELFDIKYDPPPPPVKHDDPPEPVKPPPTQIVVPRAPRVAAPRVAEHLEPPPIEQKTTVPGGAPVIAMADIAPAATGVAVAKGPRTIGPVGQGGTGTGTGSGSGGGAGAPQPMSVATIKTRAMPRGDFSYYDLGKDYPAEAKQLGIEGDIRVRLVVDEKGKVTSRVLLNRLGHGLDELAMERARQIEFTPALDSNDRPVSSVVVWTFHMTLPK
jgi:TonB family protein